MYHKLRDFKYREKNVLVRVDFNVPIVNGKITDDSRIKKAIPTIRYLIDKGAQVILISHLGRPKGRIVKELKMDIVAKQLSKLLKKRVYKLDDCIGYDIDDFIDEMVPGELVLLENLRFYSEEKKNNKNFARTLAENMDYYVNDAFGTMHRSHASVDAVTNYVRSCAGFLVEKEIEVMTKALKKPKKPFIAVLGGVKVSDKIDVINNLLKKVDKLLIGGAMMFTFLKAQGIEVGKSLLEKDKLSLAKKLLKNKKIVLAVDCVVANKIGNVKSKTVSVENIPKNMIGVDIGKETIKLFSEEIKKAKTIIYNGSMGVAEIKKFAKGTNGVIKAMAKNKGITIIGGGDTAQSAERFEKRLTHVSTGGGAALEFFEGKELVGIKALEKNYRKFYK